MAQTNLNLWEKQIIAKNTKKSPKMKFKIQAEFMRDLEGIISKMLPKVLATFPLNQFHEIRAQTRRTKKSPQKGSENRKKKNARESKI